MIARAGSSYTVRVYRSAGQNSDNVVGIVEMPGNGGTLAFKSIEELGRILRDGTGSVSQFNPDASGANWSAMAFVPEPAN